MSMKLVNGESVEMTAEEIAALQKDAEAAAVMRAENAIVTARNMRNSRLAACDWTQAPDAPLTQEQKATWAKYRQALRDVTDQAGFPNAIEWPVEPA